MKYIILHEYDSGNPHGVNIKYLQDWTDNAVWINGKRYKVTQSSSQIQALIDDAHLTPETLDKS